MVVKIIQDLFVYELFDIYSVEKQLIKVFLWFVCVVSDEEFKKVFEVYVEEI